MYKLKQYLLLTKHIPELCGFYSVIHPQILNGDYVILYQSIAKPGAKGKPLIQDFVSHVKKK